MINTFPLKMFIDADPCLFPIPARLRYFVWHEYLPSTYIKKDPNNRVWFYCFRARTY